MLQRQNGRTVLVSVDAVKVTCAVKEIDDFFRF